MRPVRERFEEKIYMEPTSGCWLWVGNLGTHGYGDFKWRYKTRKAHRISYMLSVGKIPRGLVLDHLCEVKSCVNPDHLEPVTQAENMRRANPLGGLWGAAKFQKNKTHCPHGHPYLGDNLYVCPRGWRQCRTCIGQKI